MPTIRVEMFEGRSADEKKALVAAITEACVSTIGVPADSVDILLVDVARSNWATAGVLWSEPRPKAK